MTLHHANSGVPDRKWPSTAGFFVLIMRNKLFTERFIKIPRGRMPDGRVVNFPKIA
jgi:hypothetical protein